VEKVIVWGMLGCKGIMNSYWLEDPDGCQATVSTEQYFELMRKFILELKQK